MTTNKQPFLTYTAAAAALACAFVFLLLVSSESHDDRSDPVFSREVVAYEVLPVQEGEEAIVTYEYVGDVVPEKLSPTEEVKKRTETAYHSLVAVENEGTKEETRTYEGVFYTRPTFVKQGNEWHFIEHATTTETAFNALRKDNAFASIFWRKAYAASISPFAGAGDGDVYADDDFTADWSVARSATDGDLASPTNTTSDFQSFCGVDIENVESFNIYRAFFPFDTSSMPGGSTVSAATLNIYITSKTNGDNDGTDYAVVVSSSQGTHTTLTTTDFDQVGATAYSDTPDFSTLTINTYNTLTLNASGRAAIKGSGQTSTCSATAGITCLSVREGHDYANHPIACGFPGPSLTRNRITFRTSEQTGTSEDPYLSVTYTVGGNFAFWQFQDF